MRPTIERWPVTGHNLYTGPTVAVGDRVTLSEERAKNPRGYLVAVQVEGKGRIGYAPWFEGLDRRLLQETGRVYEVVFLRPQHWLQGSYNEPIVADVQWAMGNVQDGIRRITACSSIYALERVCLQLRIELALSADLRAAEQAQRRSLREMERVQAENLARARERERVQAEAWGSTVLRDNTPVRGQRRHRGARVDYESVEDRAREFNDEILRRVAQSLGMPLGAAARETPPPPVAKIVLPEPKRRVLL